MSIHSPGGEPGRPPSFLSQSLAQGTYTGWRWTAPCSPSAGWRSSDAQMYSEGDFPVWIVWFSVPEAPFYLYFLPLILMCTIQWSYYTLLLNLRFRKLRYLNLPALSRSPAHRWTEFGKFSGSSRKNSLGSGRRLTDYLLCIFLVFQMKYEILKSESALPKSHSHLGCSH